MAKDDGGPAFPESVSADSLGGLNFSRYTGMSLRDYFAGQALDGFIERGAIAHIKDAYGLGEIEPAYGILAKGCFAIADAMLKARAK